MLRKILYLLIVVFILTGLVYFFTKGLNRDQQQMPSALLDKPLPDFDLFELFDEHKSYTKQDLVGEVFLINVFASWCPPCAKEHDVIVELSEQGYRFIGLNYQDNRDEAEIWLSERGNPYEKVLYDPQGSVGRDWGVIGVPETFLIDAHGIVRYRHIGILSLDIWNEKFLPFIQELNPSLAKSPYPFTNRAQETRFNEITMKLRCLVCQNQTVLDSDATLAKDLRQEVYQQILAGKNDQEILDYLTQRYGDFILYEPPVNKQTGLLWFAPLLLLLIAILVVMVIVYRARKSYQEQNK